MLGARERLGLGAAEDLDHLVSHDAEDRLVGGEALQDLLARGAGANALDDLLRDLEVHVGLEEGQTDLAQGFVDLGLREDTLAAKRPEDLLKPIAQRLEHARSPSGRRTPTQSKS